ncbi:class I SAM-dependent methyltransferase [Lacimicrobium alkaliphilum]|uniref:2-polyprenyl-3-methyl-5-hydroxy-6-metoxy-1, 4-benzoquinol methylase n=1 Tax=Lacimicrobium alkaliphilum TaxID=1526571 RepID=A0A0U2QQQ6_9ALTE|nr:class I SAM-dependent methyltransferase [Lacimicrobium alkaliphilum]ALT00140.1 hypothetical protein AT746_18960 [Lacimicrobium alkaliphilum]
MQCPLCQKQSSQHYWQDKRRDYRQCDICKLVFVPPAQRLSPQSEKAEYDLHHNCADDAGYISFLNRLALPLTGVLSDGCIGLDYGCGPSPVLAALLSEKGHQVSYYDPFYYPDEKVFKRRYDFISCSEAIEHFFHPGEVCQNWMSLLKAKGWLAIMTKRVIDRHRFKTWHYKNDPTHVCFFSEETFGWLAKKYRMRLEVSGPDVVLLQKLA